MLFKLTVIRHEFKKLNTEVKTFQKHEIRRLLHDLQMIQICGNENNEVEISQCRQYECIPVSGSSYAYTEVDSSSISNGESEHFKKHFAISHLIYTAICSFIISYTADTKSYSNLLDPEYWMPSQINTCKNMKKMARLKKSKNRR